MNNEPVAWRIKNPQMFNEWIVFSNKEQASLYAFHNGKGNLAEPLYTHPAKELNAGGEPVKNATYWKRQHERLLINLNVSAIKIAELEKELAILRKANEK